MHHEALPNPLTSLSASQALGLLELTDKCLRCQCENDYKILFDLLNKFIPFEKAISGLAQLDEKSNLTAYELANISYPEEWMRIYEEKEFNKIDAIVHENFSNFSPQYWKHTYKKHKPPKIFLSLAADFGLENGYTYGCRPFGFCKRASLFSFSGKFIRCDQNIISILRIIIPHMHLASFNTLENKKLKLNRNILSTREKEVLNWLKEGKSSWDMSVILGISERTVNFHIYNIMKKLEVVNRPQAVAVATHLGMLEID